MRVNLKTTKSVLWVVFIASTVTLTLLFGLNNIFASQDKEPPPPPPPAPIVEPLIGMTQTTNRLIAAAVNFSPANWQFVGPNSFDNCNSTLFTSSAQAVRHGNEVTLESTDYGYYYCFRVLAETEDYAYEAYKVADDGASISATQDTDRADRLILEVTYLREVLSWRHIGPLADEACSASLFAGSEAPTGDQAIVSPDDLPDDGEAAYYCFSAEVGADSWIYKSYQLQLSPPEFIWEKRADVLVVSLAAGESAAVGEYVIKERSSNCSTEDFSNTGRVETGNELPVQTANSQAAYCFRIQNEASAYFYTEHVLSES